MLADGGEDGSPRSGNRRNRDDRWERRTSLPIWSGSWVAPSPAARRDESPARGSSKLNCRYRYRVDVFVGIVSTYSVRLPPYNERAKTPLEIGGAPGY